MNRLSRLTPDELSANIRRCPECDHVAPLVLWDCLGVDDDPEDEDKLLCRNCVGFVVPVVVEPVEAEDDFRDLPLFAKGAER